MIERQSIPVQGLRAASDIEAAEHYAQIEPEAFLTPTELSKLREVAEHLQLDAEHPTSTVLRQDEGAGLSSESERVFSARRTQP